MSQTQRNFDGESLITPDLLARTGLVRPVSPDEDAYRTAEIQAVLLLNLVQQRLESGQNAGLVLDRLIEDMHAMRASLAPAVWKRLVPFIQGHPVAALIHEDPFARWSFEKPRGYSGDAHLIDFIYTHPDVADEVGAASPLGAALHLCTSAAPACAAARERRDLLARFVDEAAARADGGAEILTVAAGHLREADLSAALPEGRIKRWVALDQDPQSIAAVAARFEGTCIEPVNGSVRGILRGEYGLGTFDAIYAAGLYDYLPRDVSIRLTATCLGMLKPGGVFLFANFHDEIVDGAFMETFMNWELILRSEAEVEDIVDSVRNDAVAETEVFFGENRNIVYGVIRMA